MELENLMEKIPHAMVYLLGLTIVFQIYVGGLQATELQINQYQNNTYSRVVVLENLLSVEATESELEATMSGDAEEEDYSYDRRRAKIPVEFFTNRKDSEGEIGYKINEKNGEEHCYVEKVHGLDGEEFGFYIIPLEDVGAHADNPKQLSCTDQVNRQKAVFSPALLVRDERENPLLPVRLYVSEIE